jgi:hypothetical protein
MAEKKEQKRVDLVTEDTPLTGQESYRYFLISFLSPEGIRNCSLRAFKIRGVFKDLEDAKKAAAEVRKSDPDFHIYIGDMWKWVPWEPDPDTVQDQDYMNEELNNLMKDYKKNREKSREVYEKRKNDLQASSREACVKQRLREKLEKRKKKEEEKQLPAPDSASAETKESQQPVQKQETVEDLEKKLKELEEKEKNFKMVKEFLDKQKFDIRDKISKHTTDPKQ